MNTACAYYESRFSAGVPANITIQFGYSTVYGVPMGAEWGATVNQFLKSDVDPCTLADIRAKYLNNALTANALTAYNSLPTVNPYAESVTAKMLVTEGQAKILGIASNRYHMPNAFIGLGHAPNYAWTRDHPNAAIWPDPIGILLHEISHVCGRVLLGGNPRNGWMMYTPYDYFRWASSRVRLWNGTNRPTPPIYGGYFSIDGGVTKLEGFNITGANDMEGWHSNLMAPPDAFAVPYQGAGIQDITPLDMIVLDAALGLRYNGT